MLCVLLKISRKIPGFAALPEIKLHLCYTYYLCHINRIVQGITCILWTLPLPFHSISCSSFTATVVYIHAGSASITSLTFDDLYTTLTCTSTGGPATTVTWRRDGVVLTPNATHQQNKRLVDPVNGTYQTVLTIDPSVGQIAGTYYNCTVENARGMSSKIVVVTGEA